MCVHLLLHFLTQPCRRLMLKYSLPSRQPHLLHELSGSASVESEPPVLIDARSRKEIPVVSFPHVPCGAFAPLGSFILLPLLLRGLPVRQHTRSLASFTHDAQELDPDGV